MDSEQLEEILHKLEEAIADEDWDIVQEVADEIREDMDNPLDEYDLENWNG
jgi:BMFP domain-containing protein YqiC